MPSFSRYESDSDGIRQPNILVACLVEEFCEGSPRSARSPSQVRRQGTPNEDKVLYQLSVGDMVEAIRHNSRGDRLYLRPSPTHRPSKLSARLSVHSVGGTPEGQAAPGGDAAAPKLPRISVSSQHTASKGSSSTSLTSPTNVGLRFEQTLNSPKSLGPPVSPRSPALSPKSVSKVAARKEAYSYAPHLVEFRFPPIGKKQPLATQLATQLIKTLSFRRT
eukprot:EG_transcript_9596